jgi:anti-anti-sigma factor
MTRPPAFEIVTNASGATVVVEVHGELDLATVPQLTAELDRVRALPGLERGVIDLRHLVFLDSSGLEAIVKFHKAATQAGIDVAVVRGPRAVERLFEVMKLDRSLNLVDDPAELG